jgi:Ca2+-transporting ATPase
VIRNGERIRIPGREVVVGDFIVLAEGDRVPADGIILWGMNLSVDESLLTGESIAVRKCATDECAKMGVPGGDDSPSVFSGTLVVSGQAVIKVLHVGAATELGNIGKALEQVEPEETLLQKETGKIVKSVFLFAMLLCFLLIIFYGISQGNTPEVWLQGVLHGLTLAMAMLPEEFPVVLTVFLALGAWRISKKNVLARKNSAIETLGAATVLCSDKTGTLTQNRMSIRKLYCDGEFYDLSLGMEKPLPDRFHALIENAILASQRNPFDPMEKALLKLGDAKLNGTEHLHPDWSLVKEYPLSKELLALSYAWSSTESSSHSIAAKGAPEAIFDLCHLGEETRDFLSEKVQQMASEGLRLLGVARARNEQGDNLPELQHDLDFEFIGFVGLEDPIRETVPQAVHECYTAGIRVIMITGDYPGTARNIARQIGLQNSEEVLTGPEIASMPVGQLREKLKSVNIFARVVPEQKLLIVNGLKANGEIVAMTGDGVNDAPALKASHIGVAMGERGTDVAREASELVLLDDSFPSIVEAVRQGRRIFDNLRKAMAYVISVHIPIAGLSLLPVLFKWGEILFPVHIVFLELIIDPACSVVFEAEPEEKEIMRRKPRNRKEPLFGKRTLFLSVMQGIFSLGVMVAVYLLAIRRFGLSEAEARTLTFVSLIVSNLCMILTNRSWERPIGEMIRVRNPALFWVLGGSSLFLGLVITVPFLQDLFHFVPLSPMDLLVSAGAGIVTIVWFEAFKFISMMKGKRDVT